MNNYALIVNTESVFYSHRQTLYNVLAKKGSVHVYFGRSRLNLFWSVRALVNCILVSYTKIFISTPAVVIAMSLLPKYLKRRVVVLITGMGTLYQKGGFSRAFLLWVFRRYVKYSHFVVQNSDDLRLLKNLGGSVSLFRGSGVKWRDYRGPLDNPDVNFLLASRLLKSKGVMHYIEAAEQVMSNYNSVKFYVVGKFDIDNSASISVEEFELLQTSNCTYLGAISNEKLLALMAEKIDFCVLPSEREGMSKFLLEAISMGIPTITSYTPGGIDLIELGLSYGTSYGDVTELTLLFEELVQKKSDECLMNVSIHSEVRHLFDDVAFEKFILGLL